MYSINFTENNKKIYRSWHYNGAKSYSFVNGTEIHKSKAKDSEIGATPLCPGNISKDWSADNIKKTQFNGYVYDFSVNYDAIPVDGILDIHRAKYYYENDKERIREEERDKYKNLSKKEKKKKKEYRRNRYHNFSEEKK